MRKSLFIISFFSISCSIIQAQELNATVSVNSSKIQGNRQLFNTLEEHLRRFINERKWTDMDFRANEKIDCSFTFVINEAVQANSFSAELLVQARRPVYNTAYASVLLNFRDSALPFHYIEYQPLDFNINSPSDNLTAIVAFYVYLILGLDFDSMSPLGGTPYFQQMQTIAENVQPDNRSGWEAFGNQRNRHALAVAFNDPVFEPFRRMWYEYHRLGLDEMAANIEKARKKIVTSLSVIDSIYSLRPGSVPVTLFGDAKFDELARILTKASSEEKRQAHETLRKIYPTRTAELEKIK